VIPALFAHLVLLHTHLSHILKQPYHAATGRLTSWQQQVMPRNSESHYYKYDIFAYRGVAVNSTQLCLRPPQLPKSTRNCISQRSPGLIYKNPHFDIAVNPWPMHHSRPFSQCSQAIHMLIPLCYPHVPVTPQVITCSVTLTVKQNPKSMT